MWGEPAQSGIAREGDAPPAASPARAGCEGNCPAGGDLPARPVPDSGTRDAASGMQPSLTENGSVNTNVCKMADSVQE